MPHGNHFPDPGVQHGPFRVLPRTDGGFAIQDVRRRIGHQQVGSKFKKLPDAINAAKTWAALHG